MATPTAQITIHPNDVIATINPNVYGQFAEHLGRCFYDGVWVGEDSPIPNTQGFRNDVLDALRAMRVPVIRWPGGCFADDYHWQDGIGPRESRPRRINIHWGEVIENNHVGTHEFMDLCRLVGAEPYFCGNVGSGGVRELRDWVEYCNLPGDSTWAQMRAANGSPDPFNVTYWGVGNENWGCGGHFTPEDYCGEFRRYASFMRGFGGNKLQLIACGPSGNDIDWTTRFFRKLRKDYWPFNNIQAYAAHYYCGTAGTATEYTEAQWYELIAKGLEMEPLIVQQRAAMDTWDAQRRIGLIVDEWGTWHPVEEGTNPAFLYQQNTLRDAMVAATTLDIFNRHADKVVMSNIAQMVNVLQAMVLTEGDKMLVTPTGHVYAMYAPHQGGTAVRMTLTSDGATVALPGMRDMVSLRVVDREVALPYVAGSASVKGKALFLTLTNCHATESVDAQVQLLAGAANGAKARVLSGKIHAHNTYDKPEALQPQPLEVKASGASLTVPLPPASIVSVELALR
jgi:alpha-N-arabinofuranosidase